MIQLHSHKGVISEILSISPDTVDKSAYELFYSEVRMRGGASRGTSQCWTTRLCRVANTKYTFDKERGLFLFFLLLLCVNLIFDLYTRVEF